MTPDWDMPILTLIPSLLPKSPTLYFTDTIHRSGMIHMNDNRMYFLSGGIDTESWATTANSKWPLYLQTDTNAAVFGGDIDATSGTVSAAATSVSGDITCSGKLIFGNFAVPQGYMASRTITLGDTNGNHGGGSGWSTNTAALMFECADNTEIAVHDRGERLASLMYFEGGPTNRINIGRDMGWGTIFQVKMNGNVGIGKNPGYPLNVAGTVRADSFESDAEFITVYSTVVKHGGVLAMDSTTWRRVVPQGLSGYIVWTPAANDHVAAAYRVVNNSNAWAGSRDWRTQADYYSSSRYLASRYNGGCLEFSKAGTAPSRSPHYDHVTIYGAII